MVLVGLREAFFGDEDMARHFPEGIEDAPGCYTARGQLLLHHAHPRLAEGVPADIAAGIAAGVAAGVVRAFSHVVAPGSLHGGKDLCL